MNKGGLEVQVGSLRGFMPSGQVDIAFHKDISVFLGQRVKVAVQKFDRKGRNLIVSRRQVLEAERNEQKGKLFEELEEGQTRRGTVRAVMDFGAFVDLGGADGLIHISELTHRRGTKASDVVAVGDIVDVKITKFDRETGKIGLSLKQLMADPWAGAEAKYGVGSQVTGRVVKIEKFGAFIEVEEGLEGLLPISEISWQRVNAVTDVLKPDDIIKASVIALDTKGKKITFSLKQAGPDPWKTAADRYPRHEVVKAKVARIVDFGVFCELEPGLEGLVHISEVSDRRVRSASDVVKVGQEVEVRVLEVDGEKRRISLSIKQVSAPAPVAAEVPATPAAPKKPRKTGPLKGGLESGGGWFK
ncbi:MAG: S1 RNA-binding domain-containing protein [Tepidisphaeraceae bacterium]